MRKTSKIKRIFTGLLALILTLALLPAQTARIAKADDPPKVINTGADVSLTIVKYRYDSTGRTPTGTTDDYSDINTNLSDAELLNGVTFKVYKIANIVQDGNQLKYETLSKVAQVLHDELGGDHTYIDGGLTAAEIKALFIADEDVLDTLDHDSSYSSNIKQETTGKVSIDLTNDGSDNPVDTNGIAQFTGLSQGLYLVVETSAPDLVAVKADPFLVSLPMTNVTGDDWLYDVYAFPKNRSSNGSIKLHKVGVDGSVDSSSNFIKTNIENAEFELDYRKSGSGTPLDPYIWEKVTKNNKGEYIGTDTNGDSVVDTNDDGLGVFKTDNSGLITIDNLAPGTYRFREIGVPNGYILDTVAVYEFKIKYNSDGSTKAYYTNEGGNEVEVPTEGLEVINYKPSVQKDVKDRTDINASTQWGIDADYSVNDTIPYRLKVYVPKNVAQLRSFSLTDELTNQNFVTDTGTGKPAISFYSDAACTSSQINDITFSFSSDTSATKCTLEFNSCDSTTHAITSGISNYAGKIIYIRFDATLQSGATVGPTGNKNEVDLSYSNEIVPDSESTNPGTDNIHDEVIVYTFQLKITKEDTNNNKLEGISFDLYKEIDTATSTEQSSKTDYNSKATSLGAIDYDTAKALGLSITYYWKKISALETGTGGIVSKSGLSNGNYYLIETNSTATDGKTYNLLKEPVKVPIFVTYTSQKTGTPIVVSKDTFNDGSGTTDDGIYEITIVNSTGFTLPTTGGVGSVIFVFVGVSMMIAAVIMFYEAIKKKGNKKENK